LQTNEKIKVAFLWHTKLRYSYVYLVWLRSDDQNTYNAPQKKL